MQLSKFKITKNQHFKMFSFKITQVVMGQNIMYYNLQKYMNILKQYKYLILRILNT